MRQLFAIAAAMRRSLRGRPAIRLTVVVLFSLLSGATAGVLPAVVGVALHAVLDREAPAAVGLAGSFGNLLDGASAWTVIAATLAIRLGTVAISVVSSQRGSELAGEVTAALRIEMLRAALHASPRDVESTGRAAMEG